MQGGATAIGGALTAMSAADAAPVTIMDSPTAVSATRFIRNSPM